jgi:hypothetical protein
MFAEKQLSLSEDEGRLGVVGEARGSGGGQGREVTGRKKGRGTEDILHPQLHFLTHYFLT